MTDDEDEEDTANERSHKPKRRLGVGRHLNLANQRPHAHAVSKAVRTDNADEMADSREPDQPTDTAPPATSSISFEV